MLTPSAAGKQPKAETRPAASAAPRATTGAIPGGALRSWVFGSAGLRVQRKCDCGGACESCQAEQELPIQRKADGQAALAALPASVASAEPTQGDTRGSEARGILVDDDQPIAAEGQARRSDFVSALRGFLLPLCDIELAAAGRTSRDCPYLKYWLDYAAGLSAARLERAIRRFTGSPAATARGLMEAVVSRVRAAVRLWVATGQIATPRVLGTLDAAAGPGFSLSSLVSGVIGDGGGAGAVQSKAVGATSPPAAEARGPAAVRSQLGAGRALDGGVRSRMEAGFGRSFADVRLHTDANASRLASGLSSLAFTVGNQIAFRSGEYRPGTVAGDLLIAHELAHTIQQQGATGESVLPMDRDRALENDADGAAVAAVGSTLGITERTSPAGRTGLKLQGCQEVKYRCPKGYSWRVRSTAGFGSFGCTCFWKCLPGEPPGVSTSSGPEFRCPPDMNCTTGVRYEELGEDYEKKGYGAALTPLGEQPYCGCFPLNYKGEQVSDAPLTKNDFELTDVVGPLADVAAARRGGRAETDSTTGKRLPGKGGVAAPKIAGAKAPPEIGPLTTKPMLGKYQGEHLPNNKIWGSQVTYLTDAQRTAFKLQFKDGKIYDAAGNLFDTRDASSVFPGGGGSAIYVMDGLGNFYASKRQAVGEFHHSSLAAGQPVAAAGELRVEAGVFKGMTDRSGHYQPTPEMRAQAVKVLEANGVDTSGKVKGWNE